MIKIEIADEPPNKQTDADKRTIEQYHNELIRISKEQLNSKLVTGPISVEISIYTNASRLRRVGYDNTYLGDLDNLVSGIVDELKGTIIVDDSQLLEIKAKINVIEESETRFSVTIRW